jgi:hypothetical protein
MKIDSEDLDQSLAEISDFARGWHYDKERGALRCLHCAASFEEDLVHKVGAGLGNAERAVREHVEAVHGGPFDALLSLGRERTGLTEVQELLLRSFHAGKSDREVAAELGGKSESTVRNHRFQLRRREGEARLLVALMALVSGAEPRTRHLVDYPADMPARDERTDVSEEEAAAIEAKYLRAGVGTAASPLIASWPKKQKEKLVLLRRVAERFERGRGYTEPETNALLMPVWDDYVTIRRYLIEYRFLEREPDGSQYRRR